METDDVIKMYYSLKGKYDAKYKTSKEKIIKSDMSLREKKIRIQKIQRRCINCKKLGGTIFTNENGILGARCGNTVEPCKLDIQIKRGSYDTTDNILKIIEDDMSTAAEYILDIKLKFLHGLITDEVLEKGFNSVKETYKQLKNGFDGINKTKADNNSIEILEPFKKTVDRKTYEKLNEIKIGNLINQFKELIKEYKEEESEVNKNSKLNDAINIYINEIQPIFKIQRETKFMINTVIEDDGKFKLIQRYNSLKKEELDVEESSVISNKK